MASRIPALPRDSHVQSHGAVHKSKLCDSHARLLARAIAGGWTRSRSCWSRMTAVSGRVIPRHVRVVVRRLIQRSCLDGRGSSSHLAHGARSLNGE
jgi:hypothetical protein